MMLAEGEISMIQGWLQIATSTGFVGLAWYLIVIALPKMQDRFDVHSDRQLEKFENQLQLMLTRHEAVVAKITDAHEKQMNRCSTVYRAKE